MRNTTGHQNQDGALISKQSRYLGFPYPHGCTSAPLSWFQAHGSFIQKLRVGARVCVHFMVQFSKICKEEIIWTPWDSSKHVSPSRHFRRTYFGGIACSGWAQHRTGCVGPGPPCPSPPHLNKMDENTGRPWVCGHSQETFLSCSCLTCLSLESQKPCPSNPSERGGLRHTLKQLHGPPEGAFLGITTRRSWGGCHCTKSEGDRSTEPVSRSRSEPSVSLGRSR